jgi:guanosine-diphosphatase
MTLSDNMARKGYWFRNGAILAFCLTLFFFVMLPRKQPDHNTIPIGNVTVNTIAFVPALTAVDGWTFQTPRPLPPSC